jgi:hypothetical protein
MVDFLGGLRELEEAFSGACGSSSDDIPQPVHARLLLDHRGGFHSGGDVSAKRPNLESAPMTASKNGFAAPKVIDHT